MSFRSEIQEEAIQIALSNDRCGLDISVRLGKTFIGLQIASDFSKVLVCYPNNSIKNSWIQDAEKFEFSINHITFTTFSSLKNRDLSDYDCIIIDEIDQFSEANWEFLEFFDPKVIKGLSGTFPRSGIKREYIDLYCPIRYTIKLDDTSGKTSKDYEIFIHNLKPSTKKDIKLSKGGYWSEEAKIRFWDAKYIGSKNFMDMLKLIQSIQNSPTKFSYCKKLANQLDRCIIFLETKKQCEELGLPSYFSGNKESESNLEKFQNGEINKLSCVRQLSAGISFKNLNKCIILHTYASNNKAQQRLARTLNLIEGEELNAEIHILCLKGTRDQNWTLSGLAELNEEKIKYIEV